MDRLADQLVAWHNRNPLAKRITIYDVHTIGVVALPFLRDSASAAASRAAGPVEPMLADETPTETALHEPPEPPQPPPPSFAAQRPPALLPTLWSLLQARLSQLLPSLGGATGERAWPLFSERFISRLPVWLIARFALRHGHASPPGEPDWPLRAIEVNEARMARGAARTGGVGWPFELYLMSAGIDVGTSRTRVLLAQGADRKIHVLGRRCLNPVALAAVAGMALLIVGAPGLWLTSVKNGAGAQGEVAKAAPPALPRAAASAAPASSVSAAARPASEPAAAAAAAASAPVVATIALPPAVEAASRVVVAPTPASAAALQLPDIRPQLAPPRNAPPLNAALPASAPAEPNLADQLGKRSAKPGASGEASTSSTKSTTVPPPAAAGSGPRQVALVGPASASRAEAEAMLERMRELLGLTQRNPDALQAQVFQTHEGWRAAVWPFGSREEAQLVNATLVARGLRTRAVDF